MMNLEQVVTNFANQSGELGQRTQQALSYRDAYARGEISQEEMFELMEDLVRLESVQLNADELDQQIAFNECIEMLARLPL